MRLNRIIIALAGAALAASCTVATIDENASISLVTREFTATFDGGTKTSLEQGGKVLWDTSGESITLLDDQGNQYYFTQKSASSDRRTATFTGSAPESGLVLAVYPSSSNLNYDDGAVSLTIPKEQQALEGGFPTANITVSEVSDDSNTLSFKNVGSLIGIQVNAEGVSSVSIHATETSGGALAGTAMVEFESALPLSASDISTGSSNITLNGPIASGKQYYALAWPGTYSGLTVTFTHNDGRTATFTKDSEFTLKRSKILPVSAFTINDSDWTGDTPVSDVFTLVTSASSLNAGDEVLIVYRSGSLALGSISANGNYRMPADVTIDGSTIPSPGSATVLKLEAGATSGTWSFNDVGKYLCSASSGNNLQNTTEKNDFSSWSISIDSSGNADIKAQKGTSPYIRYNTGSPRFSCYNSNTNQQSVSIYSRSSGSSQVQPTVTTLPADNIGMADATLYASFSGIPTKPDPTAAFFRWGTSSSNLGNVIYDNQTLLNSSAGTFSASLTGLTEATTYYYQAVLTLADGTDVAGEVKSFTTRSSQTSSGNGYLDCYEIPAVNISGAMTTGNEASGKGYKWYRFKTTNSVQWVATHTLKESATGNKQIRSYTVLLDGSKKAPLWNAFIMHEGVFPHSVDSGGSWGSDPAFDPTNHPDWQQDGVSGYSKGHLCASNYRRSSTSARNQTYYYTNQAPQIQNGFNGGIWSQMESAIVSASKNLGRDTLYVTVGVLYEGTPKTVSGVPIPSHFYTCLMKCSFNNSGVMTGARGCSYIMENRAHSGNDYNSYKETIDNIEKRAGFDFFHNVPDEFEIDAEKETASLI